MFRAATCFVLPSLVAGEDAPRNVNVGILPNDTQHCGAGSNFDVVRVGSKAKYSLDPLEAAEGYHRTPLPHFLLLSRVDSS